MIYLKSLYNSQMLSLFFFWDIFSLLIFLFESVLLATIAGVPLSRQPAHVAVTTILTSGASGIPPSVGHAVAPHLSPSKSSLTIFGLFISLSLSTYLSCTPTVS